MTSSRKPQPRSPATNDPRREPPSAPLPESRSPEGFHPRGHGRGGRLVEGEPEGHPERDGRTQPNFGQHGTYASTEEKPEPDRDDG